MEQITVKMFVNTCDYMSHLLEEIMTSSTEIPKDTFLLLNDLMAKLLSLMSHLYRNNPQANLPAQTRTTPDVSKSMHIHPQAPASTYNTAMAQPHQYGKPVPQSLAGHQLYQIPPLMNMPYNQLLNSQPNFNNNNKQNPLNWFQNHYQPFHHQPSVLTTNNHPNIGFPRNATPTIIPATLSIPGMAPFSTVNTNTQSNVQSSFVPSQPMNIPPTNDSTQLNNHPQMPEVSVTELFAMFITSISNSSTCGITVRFFCQLCDLICNPWSSHIKDVIHKQKCEGLKKLKMKTCRLCGLYFYGKKADIVRYFKYHFEKIHLDSNEQSTKWEDSMISVDATELLLKELQSDKDSSIVKSSDSDKLKRKRNRNKKNDGEVPNLTGQNPDSPQEKTIANEAGSAIPTMGTNTSAHPDKISAPGEVLTHNDVVANIKDPVSTQADSELTPTGTVSPHTDPVVTNADDVLTQTDEVSTHADKVLACTDKVLALSAKNDEDAPTSHADEVLTCTDKVLAQSADKHEDTLPSDSSPYPQFDLLIKVMAEEWTKSSILMDVGFCDVCQLGIKSAFDWFSHTSDHKSTGDASWKEEICPKCQVKIFGLDHQKYFSLISHRKLDEMIE